MLEGNALEGKALASLVSGLVAPSISRLEVWLSALPGLLRASASLFFSPRSFLSSALKKKYLSSLPM